MLELNILFLYVIKYYIKDGALLCMNESTLLLKNVMSFCNRVVFGNNFLKKYVELKVNCVPP
jgi:hypothetical protein